MTLAIAITTDKSSWMLTDRRITYKTCQPKDDARKLLFLETKDGQAILGYAGLGCTEMGTEPSDWMSRVLRGRNLGLEESLGLLASAVRERIPIHLESLHNSSPRAHNIVISAFLNGQPKLYSIDLYRPPGHFNYLFRYTRHQTGRQSGKGETPRIAICGSGAVYLQRGRGCLRRLLSIVNAHDQGRISSQVVATAFAGLNDGVAEKERTVGHRSIVAWRYKSGGGAQELFSGMEREISKSFIELPTISHGLDINAIVQTLMPFELPRLMNMLSGAQAKEIDDGPALNLELAKLPVSPDDRLS